jgi:hypothetical protein
MAWLDTEAGGEGGLGVSRNHIRGQKADDQLNCSTTASISFDGVP